MQSVLYGICALVVFVSEIILLVRCTHSFDFWYVNDSCVNTVLQLFPWSILYKLDEVSAYNAFPRDKHTFYSTPFYPYCTSTETALDHIYECYFAPNK